MSGKVDGLFVARLSPFDHAQGSVYGGKSVKSTEIYPLDKVAWVLRDRINSIPQISLPAINEASRQT